MTNHLDRTLHGPPSLVYSISTSRRSFIAAGVQRATQGLPGLKKHPDERSDLERWEGEGGAIATRAELKESAQALRKHAAMSSRPSYDSPHRSVVEAMLTASTLRQQAVLSGRTEGPPAVSESA